MIRCETPLKIKETYLYLSVQEYFLPNLQKMCQTLTTSQGNQFDYARSGLELLSIGLHKDELYIAAT